MSNSNNQLKENKIANEYDVLNSIKVFKNSLPMLRFKYNSEREIFEKYLRKFVEEKDLSNWDIEKYYNSCKMPRLLLDISKESIVKNNVNNCYVYSMEIDITRIVDTSQELEDCIIDYFYTKFKQDVSNLDGFNKELFEFGYGMGDEGIFTIESRFYKKYLPESEAS